MKIKFLGTKGQIPISHKRHSLHSGFLVDDVILFDIGEKRFLNANPEYIFITHFHPDHAFFQKEKKPLEINTPVFAPEETSKLVNGVNVLDGPVKIKSYTISPIPVTHSDKVKSFAYLITKADKKILYTGDIAVIRSSVIRSLPKLDAVITEASFIRRGGLIAKNKKGETFGHAGIGELVDLFKSKTHRIIFTHFGSWFIKDVEAGIKKLRSFSDQDLLIEIAYDGAEFRI